MRRRHKSNTKVIPVILAGGAGTRLWPLSTIETPKQFARLFGVKENTLFQFTLQRIENTLNVGEAVIVCNQNYKALVMEQCRQIGFDRFELLLEPMGKSTAPAMTMAALYALQNRQDDDPILLILPSDHIVTDVAAFRAAVERAEELASDGHCVCFGIVPTAPNTEYGYIRVGETIASKFGYAVDAFAADAFVEKPSQEVARQYLETQRYFWNGGMFMVKASVLLQEMAQHASDILEACRTSYDNAECLTDGKTKILQIKSADFAACRSKSIDYAVMEKTTTAAVVALRAGWCDLGSWQALWEYTAKDQNNNALNGDDLYIQEVKNSYIASSGRKVVVVGMSDCVVVETNDAVLVLHKSQHADLKKIIESMRSK